ncbi:MAG: methyltransferase domain-containing protein [Candidatus Parcubacteria bacterium]|nr:methyltransferase domain-containing protein [Candidatus Parcubacteria bacterium]
MKFLKDLLCYPVLRLYAWKNDIIFYNFSDDFEKLGKNLIQDFKENTKTKKELVSLVEEKIIKINSSEINLENKYQEIYNVEYSKSNYGFVNALLIGNLFNSIVDIPEDKLKFLKIIDVGVGSGELEKSLINNKGCPVYSIFCVDTSSKSIEIINKMGISGYVGALSGAYIQDNSFNLVFLSYFIEYDTAQNDTFYDAVRITKHGGKIIFEAFLPAHIKFEQNDKTVTRGYFLTYDIDRIKKNFYIHAKKLNKNCKLEKISVGHRWVYSHYGLCKLSSIFLSFTIK